MCSSNRLISLVALFLVLLHSPLAMAQFNPTNPTEPGLPVFYYKVTTSCQPAGIAWVSGDGSYVPGSVISISTSLYNDQYTFSHWTWTIDGEEHRSEQQRFDFTTGEKDVHFVAHYRFTPTSPDDPYAHLKARLYLTSVPEGIATFSHSYGARVEVGQQTYVNVYPNQGYQFRGWYLDGRKISPEQGFWFTMPNKDTELVARFVYNPTNPSNPDDDGTLTTPGDINGDKQVDDRDLQLLTDWLLMRPVSPQFNEAAADLNADGYINAQDLTILTNLVERK